MWLGSSFLEATSSGYWLQKSPINKGMNMWLLSAASRYRVLSITLFEVSHTNGVSCAEAEKCLSFFVSCSQKIRYTICIICSLVPVSCYPQWMVSRGLWSLVRWSTCAGSSLSSGTKSTTSWIAWSPPQKLVWLLKHLTVVSAHTRTHTCNLADRLFTKSVC